MPFFQKYFAIILYCIGVSFSITLILLIVLFVISKTNKLTIHYDGNDELSFYSNKKLFSIPIANIEKLVLLPEKSVFLLPGISAKLTNPAIKIGTKQAKILVFHLLPTIVDNQNMISLAPSKVYLSFNKFQHFIQFMSEIKEGIIIEKAEKDSLMNTDDLLITDQLIFSISQNEVWTLPLKVIIFSTLFGITVWLTWFGPFQLRYMSRGFVQIFFLIIFLISYIILFIISNWEFSIDVYLDKIRFKGSMFMSTTITYDSIIDYEISHKSYTNKKATRLGTLTNPINKLFIQTELYDSPEFFKVCSRLPKEIKNILDIGVKKQNLDEKMKEFDVFAFSLSDRIFSKNEYSRLMNMQLIMRLLIILPMITVLIGSYTINTNPTIGGITTRPSEISSEKYRDSFDIFQHAHISDSGIEGQVQLYISRYRDDDATVLSDIELEFISTGKFYYNDIEIPQERLDPLQQPFDLYNGDTITINFVPNEAFQQKYPITPTSSSKSKKLTFLGEIIDETTIGKYQIEIKDYNSKLNNNIMNYDHSVLESKIRNNELDVKGIYYKLDSNYISMTSSSVLKETSAMTILFAYEYDGIIYLRGGTNIYGWGTDNLSYSKNYLFENLELTMEERQIQNIEEAMLARGFMQFNL